MSTASLSSLTVGDMGKFSLEGEEFLVIRRHPEDRVSGVTTVRYVSGREEVFVWDRGDPVVLRTGRGRLEITLIREQPGGGFHE